MIELNQEGLESLLRGVHRLPRTIKWAIHAGIVVLCLIVSAMVLWVDDIQSAVRLDQDIQRTLGELHRQVLALKDKSHMELELAALEKQLPKLKSALPNDKEMPALLDRLNASILSHSLTLGEFKPLSPVDRDVMTVIPVKVRIQGDSTNVSRIPNFLAEFPRKVSLTDFQMNYQTEQKAWVLSGQISAFAQLGVRLSAPPAPDKQGTATQGGGQ